MTRAVFYVSFFLLIYSNFVNANNFSFTLNAGIYQLPEGTYSDNGYHSFDDSTTSVGLFANYHFAPNWSVNLGYVNLLLDSGAQCGPQESGLDTTAQNQCKDWDRNLSQIVLTPRYQHNFKSKRGYFGFKLGAAYNNYDATYASKKSIAPYASAEVGFNVFKNASIGFSVFATRIKDLNENTNSATGAAGFITLSF